MPTLEALLPAFAQRGAGFWLQATRQVLARLWLDLGQYARALAQLAQPVAAPADALPAWLRADRCLLRLDAALALGQPAPAGLLDEAGAWAAADAQRGPLLQVRLLRHQRPAAVLAAAAPLAEALRAKERGGALMALQVHLARAALASDQPAMAGEAAMAVMALFEAGNAPDAMHRAEAWWVAHQALAAAGRSAAAEAALRQGERWLRGVALPQVPPPFLDSFLHRQAVNRALLAAAGQR